MRCWRTLITLRSSETVFQNINRGHSGLFFRIQFFWELKICLFVFDSMTEYQVCGLHQQAGQLWWESELSNVLHLFIAKVSWIFLLSYLFASTFYLFICKQLIVTALLVRGVWNSFLKGLQAWDEHDVCWLQTGTSHKSKLWLNFVLYLILLCLPRLGCSTCLKYASWRSWLRNGWQGSWWGASRCTLNLLAPGHCLTQLE